MEVQGKIKLVGDIQEITDSFSKRELVIVTQEQYPQTLCVEFVQDKMSLLDDFQEGQEVKIGINLRGREWKNPEGKIKYFTSLQGWRIENLQNEVPNNDQPGLDSLSPFEPADDVNKEDLDDLPF
ncbi:MAG: DUF3127 domain-containing protein [Bacteroidota bacterium]|nr:DUF3127 domain-containing protein [Bacteroidota bacterium]|tara:strand:- start:846 stop:1220 length:375 start_codon:yes stop_codon:yes gene_type:complete